MLSSCHILINKSQSLTLGSLQSARERERENTASHKIQCVIGVTSESEFQSTGERTLQLISASKEEEIGAGDFMSNHEKVKKHILRAVNRICLELFF